MEPPLLKLLWSLRIPVKPPYFRSVVENFILTGPLFGVAHYLLSAHLFEIPAAGITRSVEGGFFFGGVYSLCLWIEKKVRQIPDWDEL
jgi:hypothetical protein